MSVARVERRRSFRGMRCVRCGRKYRGRGVWRRVFWTGVVVGLLCPECQASEENGEVEVNEATLVRVNGRDAFRRI